MTCTNRKITEMESRQRIRYVSLIRGRWYWVAPKRFREAGYMIKTVLLRAQDDGDYLTRRRQAEELTSEAFSWWTSEGMQASQKLIDRQFTHLISAAVKSARSRSRSKGLRFDLTTSSVFDLLVAQGYRCALTGVLLDHSKASKETFRQAKRPSIDRIDKNLGYTIDNIRITTVISNMARSDYGDTEFYDMCIAAAAFFKR